MGTYYTALPAVVDGDIAYASDINSINTAVDTGFTLVEAAVDALDTTVEAWADKAEQWAEEAEDVAVEAGQYSAKHHALKSSASASSALGSASAASSSASSASSSASTATTQAGIAVAAASSASGSAFAASGSASSASGSASTATTQASNAATSANSAFISKTNAEIAYNNTVAIYGSTAAVQAAVATASSAASTATTQASNAATSASNAATSASNASTSASNASSSASTASGYATNAQNSAASALSSQNAAALSASNAATSASNAATSASNASTSASNASSSASTAASEASDASDSADAAAASAVIANAATAILQKKIDVLQTAVLEGLLPSVDTVLATTANLVDVFVYNTYDDYDGGAWTEQAHTQSWYTEALNTATRGSKREFPKVALIVAETTVVTIYDATETGCPMWKVYDYSSISVKAVSALNAIISIAATTKVIALDMLEDVATDYSTSSTPAIVSNACNDVAMTFIPGRTENAYGLTDPCIAVATNGGVSIIDGYAGIGTVVDYVISLIFKFISIRDGRLFAAWVSGTMAVDLDGLVADRTFDSYAADEALYADYSMKFYYDQGLGTNSIPAPKPASNTNILVVSGKAICVPAGVSLIAEELDSLSDGMFAHITTSYNTGWMKGNIKRAVICEAEGATDTVTTLLTDRSVKGTSFSVAGTLNRTPVATGAEMQALSSFSSSNYLSQIYSADLDFGTDDFYVSGVVDVTPTGVVQHILDRSDGTGPGIVIQIGTTGWIIMYISDDNFATYDSVQTTTLGSPGTKLFFVTQRVGNKIQAWANGVKQNETTISAALLSLSNASATVTVGASRTLSNPLDSGYLSMLHIGAGSLSAAQIQKMYRDELPLFQPNAKCTIQGASSAAVALGYNERYQKLLVGTSAGVTVFDGLQTDPTFYTNSGPIKALASDRKLNLCATTTNVAVKK